jgi:hypothetical protein
MLEPTPPPASPPSLAAARLRSRPSGSICRRQSNVAASSRPLPMASRPTPRSRAGARRSCFSSARRYLLSIPTCSWPAGTRKLQRCFSLRRGDDHRQRRRGQQQRRHGTEHGGRQPVGTLEIQSGAVVTGTSVIDDVIGIVEIGGSFGENVLLGSSYPFNPDSAGNTSAYSGTISGFGGHDQVLWRFPYR